MKKYIFVTGGICSSLGKGMVKAVQFARDNNVPCFWLFPGMHRMVIDYAGV